MRPFDYHAPDSIAAARAALAAGDDARPLAGGMSLLPLMKLRLATPATLVDLNGVPGLDAIEANGETLVVGALARHAAVAASSLVQARLPALAALAGGIGDPQVRNRGTLGGSLAMNHPSADYPAAVLALDATIETGHRRIAAADFFVDLFTTALAPDELVTRVHFPCPRRAAYAKFLHPASRYALVGVMVADTATGVRVTVTGTGNGVFRLADFEHALARDFSPAALDGLTVPDDDFTDDFHGSAAYRAHLVGLLARRAVAACA